MVTINELEAQVKSLKKQVFSKENKNEIFWNVVRDRNYKNLVARAEKAFNTEEYLEAFLIQSCVLEGILKDYASKKLSSVIIESKLLKEKFENFEFSKIIDILFLSKKIGKDLYESLNIYRRKRNDVIHGLLNHSDKEKLNSELIKVYKSGKDMKGFLVDDIGKEIKKDPVAIDAENQFDTILSQLEQLENIENLAKKEMLSKK